MWDLALTSQERRGLEACVKTTRELCVYRRALALLKVDHGTPIKEIASELFISTGIIYRWLIAYAAARDPATLADGRRGNGGRPRFWSDEAQRVLEEGLTSSPDEWGYKAVNWTVPLLCDHIEKVCGQRPSDRQVRQRLPDLDYVWKRPRHAIRESKSPRVRRRLRRIRQKVRNLPAGCAKLFEDETDLLLFPPLRSGWFLRGKPAEVPISGANAKRVIFGTIDVETGKRLFLARREPCAPDFQALLPLIRKEYGDRKVALLLDKASRHTAHESARMAVGLDIEFIWLPARSTNVNPMDRLWRWGKEKTCANRQHASIDYQADFFIDYLRSLSPEEALCKAGLLSQRFWLFRQLPVLSKAPNRVVNWHNLRAIQALSKRRTLFSHGSGSEVVSVCLREHG
jgi:transposase